MPEGGLEAAHAGDMGNIEIDEDGDGLLKVELAGLSLEGDNAVMGKAIILHEKEDDFGQPTGNAGGRIGCGVIVSAKDWKGSSDGSMKGSDHGSKGSGEEMKGSDEEEMKGSDEAEMKGSEKKGS